MFQGRNKRVKQIFVGIAGAVAMLECVPHRLQKWNKSKDNNQVSKIYFKGGPKGYTITKYAKARPIPRSNRRIMDGLTDLYI